MIIYIVLIFLATFFNVIMQPNKNEKNKKKYMIFMFILFLLCFSLRDLTVGADTNQYYNAFETIKNNTLNYSLKNLRFESGFILFCKLISVFTSNPQMLLVMSGLIILTGCFKFIYNNSKNYYVSLLLFIFLNYFFMYMSAMRQAMAISILLLGYEFFFKKNKKIFFVISIFLASLFHSSAFIAIILLFLPKKNKYDSKKLLLTILISIVAFCFANKIFSIFTINNKYNYYMSSEYYAGNNIAGYINYFICLILLIFASTFGKSLINENNCNYNNYLYILSLNLIFYALAAKISIFTRITTYFDIYNCVFLTYTMENVKNKDNKKIINVIFYLTLVLYWIIICLYRPEWYGCVPYKFFW